MSRPVTVLLVTDEPDLVAEWRAVEASADTPRLLAHTAAGPRDAVRIAASQEPDLVLLALATPPAELADLAAELADAAPRAALVGVLDRRTFASGDAESEFVVAATRAGCCDFLRRPLSSADVAACLRRVLRGARVGGGSGPAPGRITCFVSNKGGVGKTTLAVNVACELARRAPGRVLLVDAALQLGLCATMLDLEPAVTLHDVVAQIDRLDATLLRELTVRHECGLDLLAAPGDAVAAAAVREDHVSRVLAVARSAYDHVIVDTFPILDGIAIAAFDRADAVWLVVAPTVPAVLGTERLQGLLAEIGVEPARQRLVVNTSVPPHGGGLSARDVATRLLRDVDVVVPFTRAAVAANDTGRPVVLGASRWSGFRRRLVELADLVAMPTAARVPATPGHAAVDAAAEAES